MTEPRTPDDRSIEPVGSSPADAGSEPASEPTEAPASFTLDGADSPTQAWPSLRGPASDGVAAPAAPAAPAAGAAAPPAPAAAAPSSPFEPAPSLPPTHVAPVGDGGTFGAANEASRGRSRLRWGLALVGVLIVAAASFAIVSLVGGRPATSAAMGYMPANTIMYSEIRLDLPGDQRQKLASFLAAFPGFKDQSAIEPKIDDLFDRLVRAASHDKQTWTADIKPWFGGQAAVGISIPDTIAGTITAMSSADNSLVIVTVTDRAKAIAWLNKTAENAATDHSTYGGADLFEAHDGAVAFAINDKVMIGGSSVAVKAAIDSNGASAFGQNADVKAALATVDKDFVMLSVIRTRAYADAAVKLMAITQPGVLDNTQIDETVLAMIPAWQVSTARFENDSVVASSAGPAWAIGYDAKNRPSDVLAHVPAKTLFYADIHDAGSALSAILAKFRALPETKSAFAQFDQVVNVLGGSDAAFGWWGDTAVVVSSLADGIGGGLVIHPRDAAAADRLLTTLAGFVALGGGSSGMAIRTEDHNGTKITIIDLSGMPGVSTAGLPAGYKPEFAWATNADVTVVGYGSNFVAAVLDAGPGNSLGDDARFKALLGRVGADNIGVAFLDVAAIRALLEPIAQAQVPADKWTKYTTEIQPYLEPLDAVISAIRKDGATDRGTGAFTTH
jgi:hypothetical protein